MGSSDLVNTQVIKVNGSKIRSLAHLKELVETSVSKGDERISFEMKDHRLLVIDAKGKCIGRSYCTLQDSVS